MLPIKQMTYIGIFLPKILVTFLNGTHEFAFSATYREEQRFKWIIYTVGLQRRWEQNPYLMNL